MDFIEVNGTALRFELSGGGGTTLVLIHEMGGTLESWDLVLPTLSAGRRVLRYDTRGAGLSQKVRGTLTIDTMVDDLVALLDALGIAGKVALAGVAVGGAIALHAAVRCPAARRGGHCQQPGNRHRARSPARRAGARRADGARGHARGHGYARQLLSARAARRCPRFAAFRARWLGNDPASYRRHLPHAGGMDLEPQLPRIACPVLVIAGALDRTRPPSLVEPVARAIPGARYARAAIRGIMRRADAGALRADHRRVPRAAARERRYSVACVPKITVACEDRTPPLPCASATSQSFTCRAPHSPRSCRTASISRNSPYMPGWQ